MTQARTLLAAKLEELLPGHKVVRAQRDPGTIDQPTIIVKQQRIILEPSAPASHFQVSFVVTIVTEYTDPERAEDTLDVLVPDLIRDLETIPWLGFESAEKVVYGENFAYDITIQLIAPKE